jgi:phosphogluconate dehydratase
MYPNGQADVNHFRDAGGMSVVIAQLLEGGLAHADVETVVGRGLERYMVEPTISDGAFGFMTGAYLSRDTGVISSVTEPFSAEGGLKLLCGNLGRSVIKTSALKPDGYRIEADALVFESQEELQIAFKRGELDRDFIAVVRYQGPKANGMPELHGLMPPLGLLQDCGFKVAIVTDGRMSGASGKVPSAIHLIPEAANGGILAKVMSGDRIRLDVENGSLEILVSAEELESRSVLPPDLSGNRHGFGRELFSTVRASVSSAEEGGSIFDTVGKERG